MMLLLSPDKIANGKSLQKMGSQNGYYRAATLILYLQEIERRFAGKIS